MKNYPIRSVAKIRQTDPLKEVISVSLTFQNILNMKHPFELLYAAALSSGELPVAKSRRTRRNGGRTNYKCARRSTNTCVSGALPGSALLRYVSFQQCALCDGCVVALRLTHVSTPITVTDWTRLQDSRAQTTWEHTYAQRVTAHLPIELQRAVATFL